VAPDEQDADSINNADQQHFSEHRVAQPECRGDNCFKLLQGLRGDQVSFDELLQQGAHAPVHHEFGQDEQGHGHQKADMGFDIQQKRHSNAAAIKLPLKGRHQQQWQPRNERDHDDALANHHQRIVRQMRPPQKLEERPTQNERKVRRILQQIPVWGRFRCANFHFRPPGDAAIVR
jgi:hypothetical protein